MLNSRYPIDILDHQGGAIGSKPLNRLDKQTDIYHTVSVLLVTPRGELVLQIIPENNIVPTIYTGALGTIADVKRSGESPEQTARRCMSRQLFIDDMPLFKLGGGMHDLADGRRLYISSFYGIADPPASFSLFDIKCLVVVSPRQLDALITSENPLQSVAINLFTVWQTYKDKVPREAYTSSELSTVWHMYRSKLPL